jgi:hypothetical protein
MKTGNNHDERFAKMTFASVYPHYLAKAQKKGRSREELHQVLEWLTGYDDRMLQQHIEDKTTFSEFFREAKINPNARLITGAICGYRVEEIENPLTQQVRYLDKLVDWIPDMFGSNNPSAIWVSSALSPRPPGRFP